MGAAVLQNRSDRGVRSASSLRLLDGRLRTILNCSKDAVVDKIGHRKRAAEKKPTDKKATAAPAQLNDTATADPSTKQERRAWNRLNCQLNGTATATTGPEYHAAYARIQLLPLFSSVPGLVPENRQHALLTRGDPGRRKSPIPIFMPRGEADAHKN
ncbi:hypothetical protein XANCAGTX0491_004714 [Xanthoria calcicola]